MWQLIQVLKEERKSIGLKIFLWMHDNSQARGDKKLASSLDAIATYLQNLTLSPNDWLTD